MGKLKFLFPNNYSIYLHDTPAKYLFSQNKRAYSHGCVRVENPVTLAKLLLTDQTQWLKKVDAILKTDKETWIPVKPPMPVFIVYFTTWVDQAGNLNFRNDVYGHDKKLGEEIFGKD
ncbi:MAG: L,D-transpeptidase family protein [Saprospiraceae bacterium]|nr:L,D-transpeptidase family protein [Candidatus Parvibacillus calidus]